MDLNHVSDPHERIRQMQEMQRYVDAFREHNRHILEDPEFKKSVEIARRVLENPPKPMRSNG